MVQIIGARKFEGSKNLFKFRINKAERVIFTYGKKLKNTPEVLSNTIVFLYYVREHDKQNSIAKRVNIETLDANVNKQNEEDIINDLDKFKVMEVDIENVNNDNKFDKFVNSEGKYQSKIILSSKQREILNTNSNEFPIILLGCSGSGKTLIGMEFFYNRLWENPDENIGYFTLSNKLVEHSKRILNQKIQIDNVQELINIDNDFEQFYSKDNNIYLNEFVKFCLEFIQYFIIKIASLKELRKKFLKYNKNQFITYEKFENEFWKQNKINIKSIECRDVWQEIRGIIKGYIEEPEWKLDFQKQDLSLEEYLKVGKEYSIFDDKNIRKQVYMIYEKYKSWIRVNYENDNIIFDDNDLVYLVYYISKKLDNKLFDFIIIDEVQDFTEKQICLLMEFVKDKNNILYMGDIHQRINPSCFNQKRLKRPYHDKKLGTSKLNIQVLEVNYRSQKYLADLSNKLSEIRKKKILSKTQETEIEQTSFSIGIKPYLLNFNESNLRKFIKKVTSDLLATAMVILPNEKEKENFITLYNIKDSRNIFTVYEAKGLECKYVISYNMLSVYEKEWNEIFIDNAKKNSKYLYFFNIFYVAITRSIEYLYIFEDKKIQLLNELKDYLQSCSEYNDKNIYFVQETRLDKAKKAQDLEDEGKFKEAILFLEDIKEKLPEDIETINRCKAKLYLETQDYNMAFEFAAKLNNSKDFKSIIKNINKHTKNNELKIITGLFLIGLGELYIQYGKINVNNIILKYGNNKQYKNLIEIEIRKLLNNKYKIIETEINNLVVKTNG